MLADAGVTPQRWRIPWGHLADFTPELARERELEIVGWSADTHDWRGDSAAAMLEALELEHGGIVLAHDGVGDRGAPRHRGRRRRELVGPLVARSARTRASNPVRSRPVGRSRSPWGIPSSILG